ncbi:MAG: hypothetical protein ACYC9V_12200, partial [Desulfobacteria bacterium]
FIAGTEAISYPGKIAFPPRSFNGMERVGRRMENIYTYWQSEFGLFALPERRAIFTMHFAGEIKTLFDIMGYTLFILHNLKFCCTTPVS